MTSEKNKPKFNNFTVRFLSALVALLILASTLFFFKSLGAIFLILILSAIVCIELCMLFFSSEIYFKYCVPLLITLSLGLMLNYPNSSLSLLPAFLGLILLPWLYRNNPISESYDRMVLYLVAVFYCLYLPFQIHLIFNLDPKFLYFGFFALLVFGIDTLAYFCGKAFGKRFFKGRFQAQISPSKTFEGFLGSLLWPLVLILSCHYLSIFSFSWLSILLLYLTAFAAISGDLIASLIKRKSLKKDSGQLFLGHGGFFDRLDSLLLSAPLFLMSVPYFQIV